MDMANTQDTKNKNDTIHNSLLEQVIRESRAMVEYALTNGLQIPSSAITTLERFEENSQDSDTHDSWVEAVVGVHAALSRLISPAKPRTIVLLKDEQTKSNALRFLGPVSLIRQLMIAAIICLVLFICLALSPAVNETAGNILTQNGLPLLINLVFYLSAAGLGASFSSLYKANYFITHGTFDPTYHASYWIRFFLGLIAGLLLSVLISDQALKLSDMQQTVLEPGIVRPLLAILGGFSADLAYTVLNRLVETFESLFRGSTKEQVSTQVKEEKGKLIAEQTQQQMKLVTELSGLQQQLSNNGNSEQAGIVSRLLNELVPYSNPIPTTAKNATKDKKE